MSGRKSLPNYSLKPKDITPILELQLGQLEEFLTASRWPRRAEEPIRHSTVRTYKIYILRMLGWFKEFARPLYDDYGRISDFTKDEAVPLIPIEKLTLDLLVPSIDGNSSENSHIVLIDHEWIADYVELWLCKFLDYLEFDRCNYSVTSLMSPINCVIAIIRFKFYKETKFPDYSDISVMNRVRQLNRELNRKLSNSKPVADITLKWLDLPDIFQKVVTPLRHECAHRTSTGHRRSITSVAHSFQLFLIFAFLTLRPPRRLREYRDLKIGLSCPLERPKMLKNGQFIHPLPINRTQNKHFGYLYKSLDGIWYMDMTPESYKTGKIYGHQKLRIPNTPFSHGKCCYDYLEAYLYGYYLDPVGNWISGGEFAEPPIGEGKWQSLRMAFEPNHSHVFVKPKSGIAFDEDSSDFGKLIRATCNRLTGQRVSCQLIRDIFATWFLDQGYSPDKIASLAYAMGHSEEKLRKVYDRRKSQQKNRPIEESIAEAIQEFII